MVGFAVLLGVLALTAWIYLTLFHGRFWHADQRLTSRPREPEVWPEVVAGVPARNEADLVAEAVDSLLRQDYPGRLSIILVDDRSTDGTAEAALATDRARTAQTRLVVVPGQPLPYGWVGKVWAMAQGLEQAATHAAHARYILFTDADVGHAPDAIRHLVAKAEAEELDLVSLMVRLRCETFWERLLIPAFVFFFQKLYPFPRVNHPASGVAGATGGTMLARRAALERIDGVSAIRDAVIDDCALARAIKARGAIWLGLAEESRSLRRYEGLDAIWQMVARSAFTQLGHSWLLLAATVILMPMLYIVPPATAVAGLAMGEPWVAVFGITGWLLMLLCYLPTLRLYGRPKWEAALLPASGFLYTVMTIDSARGYLRGEGGNWKGRSYSAPTRSQ